MNRLAESEWRFDGLPAREVDPAFWWEFGRSSRAVRALVSQLRQERRHQVASVQRQGTYPSPTIRRFHLYRAVCWLAPFKEFPEAPWLDLPEGLRRIVPVLCPRVAPLSLVFPRRGRVSSAGRHAPAVAIAVDWRASDADLADSLADFDLAGLICASRPEAFAKYARTKRFPAQAGIDDTKLPFKKASALRWLGTLRRREALPNWRAFGEAYGEGAWADPVDFLRTAKKQVQQAREILAWFDTNTGAPLDPDTFK